MIHCLNPEARRSAAPSRTVKRLAKVNSQILVAPCRTTRNHTGNRYPGPQQRTFRNLVALRMVDERIRHGLVRIEHSFEDLHRFQSAAPGCLTKRLDCERGRVRTQRTEFVRFNTAKPKNGIECLFSAATQATLAKENQRLIPVLNGAPNDELRGGLMFAASCWPRRARNIIRLPKQQNPRLKHSRNSGVDCGICPTET